MKNLNLAMALLTVGFLGTSCGVKGRPQPPLTPALLGRGAPSFSKATEKVKVQKQNPKKIEGDFEEPEDFDPVEEKK